MGSFTSSKNCGPRLAGQAYRIGTEVLIVRLSRGCVRDAIMRAHRGRYPAQCAVPRWAAPHRGSFLETNDRPTYPCNTMACGRFRYWLPGVPAGPCGRLATMSGLRIIASTNATVSLNCVIWSGVNGPAPGYQRRTKMQARLRLSSSPSGRSAQPGSGMPEGSPAKNAPRKSISALSGIPILSKKRHQRVNAR